MTQDSELLKLLCAGKSPPLSVQLFPEIFENPDLRTHPLSWLQVV